MHPFGNKKLEQVTYDDFDRLVRDGVTESVFLDYKRELPPDSNEAKNEFVADVSSFANARGGYLIFGVDEQEGIPSSIVGLGSVNLDSQALRLQELVRDSIRPRINGLKHAVVTEESRDPILIIEIPQSWQAPHQIIRQKSFRFYSRSDNGKYLMDIDEIRASILAFSSIPQSIKKFHNQRLSDLRNLSGAICLASPVFSVTHFFPLSALNENTKIDLKKIEEQNEILYSIAGGGYFRYNLDGYLVYPGHQTKYDYYAQIFRNGAVEAAATYVTTMRGQNKVFPVTDFEIETVKQTKNVLRLFDKIDVLPPIAIIASLSGVRGMQAVPPQGFHRQELKFDRDVITLPELIVDEPTSDVPELVRNLLDSAWNAVGLGESPNFDAQGRWRCLD